MSAEKTVTPKLVVRDLNLYYRSERALKDINLTIQEKW
jgi:ABC-type phosphate transport system ATPase subunit